MGLLQLRIMYDSCICKLDKMYCPNYPRIFIRRKGETSRCTRKRILTGLPLCVTRYSLRYVSVTRFFSPGTRRGSHFTTEIRVWFLIFFNSFYLYYFSFFKGIDHSKSLRRQRHNSLQQSGNLGEKTGTWRMQCGRLGLVSQVSSLPSFLGNTALLLIVKIEYGGKKSDLRISRNRRQERLVYSPIIMLSDFLGNFLM